MVSVGDVTSMREKLDCSATGAQTGAELFRVINSRCAFGQWSYAGADVNGVRTIVFESHNAGDNQASSERALDTVLQSVPVSGPSRFTVHVVKKVEEETQ